MLRPLTLYCASGNSVMRRATKLTSELFLSDPSAYVSASDLNVVVINWCMLARGPHYEAAARNTKEAGRSLANFLENLIRETQGAARQELHIVGFSLGAQVAGITAAQLRTGLLNRITGAYLRTAQSLPLMESCHLLQSYALIPS
jgi:pimeloyl-ACP methyl ester carboxylesterase